MVSACEGGKVGRSRVKMLTQRMGAETRYCRPRTTKPEPAREIDQRLLRKVVITRPHQVGAMAIIVSMVKGFVDLTVVPGAEPMRCYYLSDLHLEAQHFGMALPEGGVLIIAGDLCHARCLEPTRTDRYSIEQRGRAMRLIDEAVGKFARVLLIAGNHEHYDGVFEDTADLMRRHLPGVTVLDNEAIEIDGVRFFGATLWTDLSRQGEAEVTAIRKGMGEYFFVKTKNVAETRRSGPDQPLAKLRPADTHRAHETTWTRLREAISARPDRPMVVITHHAPSHRGLNPRFSGSPLDPAYASSLDEEIETFETVPVWVHGHTHIAKTYRIGKTVVRSNALGFAAKGGAAPGFSIKAHFEIQ